MKPKTDKQIILEHLQAHGTLTALTAWQEFNILTSLRSRISDLRKEGHLIETEIIHNGKKQFAKYTLIQKPQQLKFF